jgi:ubiquinone/menaquinone biosynthesis C-methylase UbiE
MSEHRHHVCPWWMGYFLASPLRRLIQSPERIIGPYLGEGMRVLEIGPGMGFFTIPMARMVGEKGKIYCVDIQQRMLDSLGRRAYKSGLTGRIECRLCTDSSFGISDLRGTINLAVAIAVVHEVSDSRMLFREIRLCLNEKGNLLVAEPRKRVSAEDFSATLSAAAEAGFVLADTPRIRGFRSALLALKPLASSLDVFSLTP